LKCHVFESHTPMSFYDHPASCQDLDIVNGRFTRA
jgi:hypothetical protein